MCDVSDYVVEVVLRQRKDKKVYWIYYAIHTLDEMQINYATIENKLLTIVFAFDKFSSHLVGSKVIIYIDHSTTKYLLRKKDAKQKLIRCILLL